MVTKHPNEVVDRDVSDAPDTSQSDVIPPREAPTFTGRPPVRPTDEQALIEEARHRQRRRHRWIAVVVVVVVGVGLGIGFGLQGTKAPTPHSVSTTPPQSVPNTVLRAGTPVPVTTLSLVSFVDDLHGIAVVGQPNVPGALHQLATTSNGGVTWRAVGAALPGEPATYPPTDEQQTGFTFTSTTTGYLLSCCTSAGLSVLYRTTDGGLQWTALTPTAPSGSPTLVRPLAVATYGDNLWALGAITCTPPLATQQVCDMGVLSSDNNGNTWTTLPLPVQQGVIAVARTSPQDAAILEAKATGKPDELAVQLFTTHDAGSSWQVGSGPPCTEGTPTALVVVANETLVQCEGPMQAGWWGREYWATTDAGATWTLKSRQLGANLPPFSSVPPNVGRLPIGEGADLTVNGGTIWAAVNRSTLYRSDDGGITWKTVGVKTQGTFTSGEATFVDPEHGWVVYFGLGIWRTTDGGSTWHAVARIER